MLNLKKIAAILVGKGLIFLSRVAGNQGTNLPGRIACKIYPSLLKDLGANTYQDTFIITGTNGKTTTSNMIAAIMRENGSSYVHNRAGANMISGITTAFIQQTNLLGNRAFDYALLETDEANVPLLLAQIKPRFILITNFFRDQLDRYGELDHTINLIKEAVKKSEIEMILNSDDPLESHFQNETGLPCWYYGFANTDYDSLDSSESREGRYCVFCGHELEYTRYHYAQLGDYHCAQCGNHNPPRDYTGHDLQMSPSIRFQVNDILVNSPYQGFFNAYNILAAVSLSNLAGIKEHVIQTAIAKFQPEAGRMETFNIGGKKAVLVLVKNPTGLNQSLSMLTQDTAVKNLFIALNDNAADGRDISWIWDAEVEVIAGEEVRINQVICSGQRSGDIALRVKYCGVESEKIIIQPSLREGIVQAVTMNSGVSYILCTYTALFASRKILLKMQRKYPAPELEREQGNS
jgi:UDP-N-acetylmuramyl tripeptide synthase